jgi:hypothetical protein
MQIAVSINLLEGEEFAYTPEEAAQVIINALDGVDPSGDYCSVMISSTQQGHAGYVAQPAPPPPPPEDPSSVAPPPVLPLETNGPPPA